MASTVCLVQATHDLLICTLHQLLSAIRPRGQKCPHVQTKETLTLRSTAFGSKPSIPETLLKKVEGLVKEQIMEFANLKQNKELAKTDGTKKNRIRGQQLQTCFFSHLHS